MRKTKSKKVILNRRDRDLFNFLYEVKVANSWQVVREIYPNLSITIFYRRINKLIRAKLIKRIPALDEKRGLISVYTLSKSTLTKYILGKNDVYANHRCHSDSVTHDLYLTEIRHYFRNCGQVQEYFTENIIQSETAVYANRGVNYYRGLNGDALAIIKVDNQNRTVAIEYEHTIKYSSRYYDYFNQYNNYKHISALLYIVRDKKMLRTIQEEEKKVTKPNNFVVYYAVRDELFENPKELIFTASDGEKKFILTQAH